MENTCGLRLIAHCSCGCAYGGELVAVSSPPDPVEDLRRVVAGLLDEHGNERRCRACGCSLFDPNIKLLIVYRRDNPH